MPEAIAATWDLSIICCNRNVGLRLPVDPEHATQSKQIWQRRGILPITAIRGKQASLAMFTNDLMGESTSCQCNIDWISEATYKQASSPCHEYFYWAGSLSDITLPPAHHRERPR